MSFNKYKLVKSCQAFQSVKIIVENIATRGRKPNNGTMTFKQVQKMYKNQGYEHPYTDSEIMSGLLRLEQAGFISLEVKLLCHDPVLTAQETLYLLDNEVTEAG